MSPVENVGRCQLGEQLIDMNDLSVASEKADTAAVRKSPTMPNSRCVYLPSRDEAPAVNLLGV